MFQYIILTGYCVIHFNQDFKFLYLHCSICNIISQPKECDTKLFQKTDIPYRVLNVCQPCFLHGPILRPAEFGPRREMLVPVSVSAWHAYAIVQQQQPVPDAGQTAVKHLRHATANLVQLESDCSTLVATDCVSNATIHLQHKENSTCEYVCNFISYQNIFDCVPCICSIMAITSQDSQLTFNDSQLTQGTVPSVGRVHDIKYMDWKK